jgi:ATP-dependent RNA helicase DDX23/PRP28
MSYKVACLHGGKQQDQREASLKRFREGKCDILIGTDVLGRGIDVDGVNMVVNYDLPQDIDRYQHRIG